MKVTQRKEGMLIWPQDLLAGLVASLQDLLLELSEKQESKPTRRKTGFSSV